MRRVTAYVAPGVAAFAIGVICEIFADRSARGLPAFELRICTDNPGPILTDLGMSLHVPHGLDAIAEADLVVLLPGENYAIDPGTRLSKAVLAAYERGAIVAAYCVGTFLLAAIGLLDGRRATTHWKYAAELAAARPTVRVRPDALYVDEGRVLTGAGVAAGIDLCLHLIRREHGSRAANEIARTMVVQPHRNGGQAQFVTALVSDQDDDRFADVITWARSHLDESPTVDKLAERAFMSPRTFARRFREVTGATPHAWLTGQRLQRAEELLEAGRLPVEEVARQVGYGSAAALRAQFVRHRGVPPRDYRRTFAMGGSDASSPQKL